MKILKKLLFVVLTLVGIILLAALFVDGKYAVVKEIEINKPKEEVFNYIKYLQNQDDYSVWANMDPDMKKTYKGVDGEVGFISAWESNDENVGKGEQEIIAIDEGNRIDFELRFELPFEATDQAYMSTTKITDNKTNVTWAFNGEMSYPTNLMLLFMDMEDMLGDDLGTGLSNLKQVLEEK